MLDKLSIVFSKDAQQKKIVSIHKTYYMYSPDINVLLHWEIVMNKFLSTDSYEQNIGYVKKLSWQVVNELILKIYRKSYD